MQDTKWKIYDGAEKIRIQSKIVKYDTYVTCKVY